MKPPPSLEKYRDDKRGDKAPDGAMVLYRGLRGLLSRLVFFIPTAGAGLKARVTNDGPVWDLDDAFRHPLYVTPAGRVIVGTVGGEVPKIGTESIELADPPLLELTGTGMEYVVLHITATLTVDGGVYVAAGDITAVTLTVETTPPGTAGTKSTTGEFHLLLATFDEGVKTGQSLRSSLNVKVCDDGTGDARGLIYVQEIAG